MVDRGVVVCAMRDKNKVSDVRYVVRARDADELFGGELRRGVWQLRGTLGTFGFVISQAGAVKMLDFAVESDKPIDHVLDSAISTGRILAFQVQPALVVHRSDISTTFAYYDT